MQVNPEWKRESALLTIFFLKNVSFGSLYPETSCLKVIAKTTFACGKEFFACGKEEAIVGIMWSAHLSLCCFVHYQEQGVLVQMWEEIKFFSSTKLQFTEIFICHWNQQWTWNNECECESDSIEWSVSHIASFNTSLFLYTCAWLHNLVACEACFRIFCVIWNALFLFLILKVQMIWVKRGINSTHWLICLVMHFIVNLHSQNFSFSNPLSTFWNGSSQK